MSLSRRERNEQLELALADLAGLRGVTTAALVDSDGFVTHVRRDFEIDLDALGAAVRLMTASAERAADQTGQQSSRMVISENRQGVMLAAPLENGFTLAIVADPSALLGTVRYELKQSVPEIEGLFAS